MSPTNIAAPLFSSPIRVSTASPLQSRALAKTDATPLTVGIVDRDRCFVEQLEEMMSERDWDLLRMPALPSTEELRSAGIDALLVDVAMVDEVALAQLVQAEISPRAAIIACTEESTVIQRVRGLQAGLDGWIEKPCQPQETVARVQAIVRTREAGKIVVRQPLRSGELDVRRDCFDAIADGRAAGLTTREFEVLELLVRNEDVVLAREQIYTAIWGYEMLAGDRVVDIFVSRIRRKLARVSVHWSYLHTHPGHGYRFAAQSNASEADALGIGVASSSAAIGTLAVV